MNECAKCKATIWIARAYLGFLFKDVGMATIRVCVPCLHEEKHCTCPTTITAPKPN